MAEPTLRGKLIEQGPFFDGQNVRQLGSDLEKRLDIGQVLKALRSPSF